MKQEESKLDLKLKAIKSIVDELTPLEEKDRQDIISFVLKELSLSVGIKATETTPPPLVMGTSLGGSTKIDSGKSMDRFVSEKKPANLYQRIAVIAYYLKFKEGKTEFKNTEIDKINTTQARQPRIGNITDVIAKAQNPYKFLTKGIAPATHQLSVLGEEVVEALPSQEEIKRILKDSKTRKTRKKTKKNRKSKAGV